MTIVTFGAWLPVWLTRFTIHKVDRNREALWEIERQLERLRLPQPPPDES